MEIYYVQNELNDSRGHIQWYWNRYWHLKKRTQKWPFFFAPPPPPPPFIFLIFFLLLWNFPLSFVSPAETYSTPPLAPFAVLKQGSIRAEKRCRQGLTVCHPPPPPPPPTPAPMPQTLAITGFHNSQFFPLGPNALCSARPQNQGRHV